MASPGLRRPVALLLALALGLAALAIAAGSGASPARDTTLEPAHARTLDRQAGPARIDRVARAAILWRGGPTLTSKGESVTVFVSESLPVESEPAGGWAEFVGNLTHGPEIAQLRTYVATLAEVQEVCGSQALGCYGRNEMYAVGETVIDGTTAEEVVRHEYGHHVAYHRLNTPWAAIDWGPKNWASAADVCGRVQRSEAFPRDGGRNYAQDPGEAWAETYRLMDERKVGITTQRWPIISPSFFPSEAALVAAERDVVQPWTATTTSTFRRTFGRSTRKIWLIPLPTPLDGELRITATVPRAGLHEVALVGADRSSIVRRAQWIGQRAKRLAATICGQRSHFVRVTQRGSLGRVTVSVTRP